MDQSAGVQTSIEKIDVALRKYAVCSSELDSTEQTSWMLLLKHLDDIEYAKAIDADVLNNKYKPIIDSKHWWNVWATPKNSEGNFEHDKALLAMI